MLTYVYYLQVEKRLFTYYFFFQNGGNMKKNLLKLVPFFIMASFLVTGCNQDTSSTTSAVKPVVEAKTQKPQGPVYKGTVVGLSNKAKSISIRVGKGKDAQTVMVKFDDNTKGVEHASKGHASIIAYEMRDGQPWATVVKPKLAKMPKGVTEIKVPDLKALLDTNADFVLIDARPAKRYAAGHIAGAINIGVKQYKKVAFGVMPKDKSTLIIAYCGGPT
jgi:hypothetical protein